LGVSASRAASGFGVGVRGGVELRVTAVGEDAGFAARAGGPFALAGAGREYCGGGDRSVGRSEHGDPALG
jgi:hypothetical protein